MPQLRRSLPFPSLFLLSALSLLLACGGGQGASTASSVSSGGGSTPAPAPRPAEGDPFWATDTPIRPEVAPLFRAAERPAPVVALSPAQAAEVAAARTSRPGDAPRPALQTLAGQLRIVVGLRSLSYHQDGTTALLPLHLSSLPIQALVPNSSGGYDLLTGQGHDDGTFSISGVPEGYYWLRFGSTYVWTSASYVDWSTDQFGRSDAAYAGTSPTALSFNLTDLAPWQGTDELVYDAPNEGQALSLPLGSADIANAPAAGATALAGFSLDLAGNDLVFPLPDASKGDQVYLNQLTTRSAGGESYRALSRTYVAPAFTVTDGTASNLSGGFLELPQAASLRLNWRRSAFQGFAPAIHPSSALAGSFLFTYAYPLPSTYGLPYNAFQLLDYTSAGTGDVDLGDLSFGNPFPAAWNVAVESYQGFSLAYLAPGASTPVTMTRYAYQASTSLPTAAAPLAPLLGPIQAPKINGKDLFANQVAVGTTPTLSWGAPALGPVSGYVITCYQLSASGTASTLTNVARFRTRTTSIKLPSGVLNPGNTYVFTVAAIRANGVDLNSTPFKTALPYAFVTTLSGIVAP